MAEISKREMPHATFGFISINWQDKAACSAIDVAVFYYDTWTERLDELNQIRRVCAECPVRAQCLEYALDTDDKYGVWGGLTPRERRQVKRERRESAA